MNRLTAFIAACFAALLVCSSALPNAAPPIGSGHPGHGGSGGSGGNGGNGGHGGSDAGDRPNVLMIAVDDLNDWVGCLNGHPQAHTPNIDRLARRGLLFTNAHCQAPICGPSRISMMTGRLPSSTGFYLLEPSNFRLSPQLARAVTLPEAFAQAGYRTMGVGKLFHNSTFPELFQHYGPLGNFGPLPEKRLNVFVKEGGPEIALWDWGPYPTDGQPTPDHRVADYAVKQLQAEHDRPFFLAAGFFRPHVPMYAPPEWFDVLPPEEQIALPPVLANDRDDLPDYGQRLTAGYPAPRQRYIQATGRWRQAVKAYLASIAFVDDQIGRVLDALDDSPHADNTLVILWSDHGFAMGEKQRWAKRALWERETRVPMIIAGPGVAIGQTDQPVGLIDLYPTLDRLCGLSAPDPLEGEPLTTLLTDPNAKLQRPAVITTFHVNNHALRSDRYRYIQYADGSEELYDHTTDPHEWHNLANRAEHVDTIARFRALLPAVDTPAVPESRGLGAHPDDYELFNVPN